MKEYIGFIALLFLLISISCNEDSPKKFTVYQDLDEDGYGNSAVSKEVTKETEGYVLDDTDCNDSDENINPGATEVSGDGGLDNNCDGLILTSCGDGAVEGDEECDDGNTVNGEGCSETCLVEVGWECTGDGPSLCAVIGS